MKTKFLAVTDTLTKYNVLVLQFEEADRAFCASAHFDPGLKILLHFSGRHVSCLAGYDLADANGATFDECSTPFPRDGTALAFKEIVHFVEDVTRLPDDLNVEAFRRALGLLRHRRFIPQRVRDICAEYDRAHIRKVLYRWGAMTHLAIVDLECQSVLFDVASTGLENLQAEYLWIPADAARREELDGIDLSPFPYELV